jgi:hypothetical protein
MVSGLTRTRADRQSAHSREARPTGPIEWTKTHASTLSALEYEQLVS